MKQSLIEFVKKSTCLGTLCFLLHNCEEKAKYVAIDSLNANIERKYLDDLNGLILEVTKLNQLKNIDSLKTQFKRTRLQFKKLEPLLDFCRAAAYKGLNQPNLPTLHEDSNGVVEEPPQGFQVLEESLFSESPNLEGIHATTTSIQNLLILERNNANLSFFKDHHFLWMLRRSLIRVMSMGITGFDSPVIQHSIPETKAVLISLKECVALCKYKFVSQDLYKGWSKRLQAAIDALEATQNFELFDRYTFIKDHIHPLLQLWRQTKDDWQVVFPFPTKVNYEATSFFSDQTFNIDNFRPRGTPKITDELISLGKDLFNDERLSTTKSISCATCHVSDNYFTDGLPKARSKDNRPLLRNTPTLYYSALQANQFYDGRVRNLENQIKDVVENKEEFHSNLTDLEIIVTKDSMYSRRFTELYRSGINQRNIRNAIANYVRSLTPFNSKFDRNISGVEDNLSPSQIRGFNLFMGKAQCATCHFAPIFSGTVPPNFSHSEFEVLGVPRLPVFKDATIDPDKGRYNLYGAKKREFAFKTSTVRNADKTAPYMHNGVYGSLEEVMKFYDLGGGHGIGIALGNQTLPPEPLNLTEEEINSIIDFMRSLTDDVDH